MKAILLFAAVIAAGSCEVLVESPTGSFLGATLQTRRGRDIYAFRGIRYGEAPVGELRFQEPVGIMSYEETVNATVDGPLCPGTSAATFSNTSEDCLMVNVYTPYLPSESSKKLPVVVYIRGGAFIFESGRSVISGPQYLLDHDIIMVTFNFRQGFLGFLSTGDELAPGNNGLKDQVALLKWVQRNIEAFGGDSESITLLSDDSGAFSVALHMVSPMSKGLFHKVIMMGGALPVQWSLPSDQLELATRKAISLGCEVSTTESVVQCLQSAGTEEYFNMDDELYTFAGQDPYWIYRPVIEGDFGQERFIEEDPYLSISEGKVMDVPVIAGITELDLAYHGYVVVYNDTYRSQFNAEWSSLAKTAFLIESGSEETVNVLKNRYLRELKLSEDENSAINLGKIYADALTGFPVNRFVNVMSNTIKSDIFYYKFSYEGSNSWYINPNTGEPIGAVHRDDTIYILQSSTLFTPIGTTGEEGNMVDVMTSLWVNFIARGNPNPSTRNKRASRTLWPKFNSRDGKYLQINGPKDITSKSHMFRERYQLWDYLFPVRK